MGKERKGLNKCPTVTAKVLPQLVVVIVSALAKEFFASDEAH
jgi:hypothetical protein